MNKATQDQQKLMDIARRSMISRGLDPDFSPSVLRELENIQACATDSKGELPDLSSLMWCSIDNDDSMDLDQITYAEPLTSGQTKLLVGVADVDALVKVGSEIDRHAMQNTTSVYTGVQIFPMLPEKLSTDLTSFSEGEARIALVVDMTISPSGDIVAAKVYRALARNHIKLAYDSVADWLEGKSAMALTIQAHAGLAEQLRLQDTLAQKLRKLRFKHGALELETIEPRAVIRDGMVVELKQERKNRARELIEDFMIAANGVTARFLADRGYPTLRRVVRSPERWERIANLAMEFGEELPAAPDSRALAMFLTKRKAADPLRFPDLSLVVIKLLGRGEYILDEPGTEPFGHFGLAVRDYAHSTAPNRRFPDLITHRLLKAALQNVEPSYSLDQLRHLAAHCTTQEDAAEKVERQVRKSAAASLLASRIGQKFEGLVTGASSKGTWVRVFDPPVEGKLMQTSQTLDVGDSVRVKLLSVNIERGFIDFQQI